MSSANSITASVIARVQGAAGHKGQKHDDSGGQAFAAIMRGTKSAAVVTANSGSHAKPRAEQTEVDASAHGQPDHGPVRTDALAHRTMRQALPDADTSNGFAIQADRPAKGAGAQSVVIGMEAAAEPEDSGTKQDSDKAKAEGASSKSARPTSEFLPVAAKTENAEEAKAGAPIEIAEPVREVPAGAATEIKSTEKHDTADRHPKIRVATDPPALSAVSTGAQGTVPKRIMETRQTAALHDAKVQEARAEHRREPGKALPSDETKATTHQADAKPRDATQAVDSKTHSGKNVDTNKTSKSTDVDGAAAPFAMQNDRDPVVPTLHSDGEAKPLPAKAGIPAAETGRAGQLSDGKPDPAPGNSAAGRPSTQSSPPLANAQPSTAAVAPARSASAQTGIAPAQAVAAPAPASAPAATAATAVTGGNTAPAVTGQDPAPTPVKAMPTRAQPVVETQQASAPQAFRAELTMAAANYAIFSGKSQTDAATPVAQAETAVDADDAEIPSQPIRIAILPPRAPQAAAIPIAIPVPVAGAATAPSAPTAQAQADAAAAALEAGLDDPAPIDSADAKSQNRPDPVAAAGPVRSAATDSAFPQPAPTPAGAVASTVMAAIASEPTWRPANVAALSHSPTSALAAEPKTLSIQLHPAELGVVTATLRLSGDQLTVEISAESAEARSRLSADSHAIAKSLRALGFDVDQVSIIQPMITSTPAIRTDDTSAVAGPQMRDQQSSGAGTSGGGGGRLGGQQTERNGNDGGSASRGPGTPAADRSGGGLYI